MGFNAEYEDARLDDNKKNLLGEESYVYEKDCSILEQLLANVDYDTLIQKKCVYSVEEMEGTKYPTSFTAVVQYVKGNVTYTKTAYLDLQGGMRMNFWRKKIPVRVTMSVEPVGRPENVVRAAVEAAVNKGEAL